MHFRQVQVSSGSDVAVARWTPRCFCLVIVQKEPISSHPRTNSVKAVGHAVLKCFGLWQTTNTKNLGIIHVCVRRGISRWSFISCSRPTSATYKTNRIGLRTDPCGTLYKTNDGVDLDAGVRTYWLRPVRYEANQPITVLWRPYDFCSRLNIAFFIRPSRNYYWLVCFVPYWSKSVRPHSSIQIHPVTCLVRQHYQTLQKDPAASVVRCCPPP